MKVVNSPHVDAWLNKASKKVNDLYDEVVNAWNTNFAKKHCGNDLKHYKPNGVFCQDSYTGLYERGVAYERHHGIDEELKKEAESVRSAVTLEPASHCTGDQGQ